MPTRRLYIWNSQRNVENITSLIGMPRFWSMLLERISILVLLNSSRRYFKAGLLSSYCLLVYNKRCANFFFLFFKVVYQNQVLIIWQTLLIHQNFRNFIEVRDLGQCITNRNFNILPLETCSNCTEWTSFTLSVMLWQEVELDFLFNLFTCAYIPFNCSCMFFFLQFWYLVLSFSVIL